MKELVILAVGTSAVKAAYQCRIGMQKNDFNLESVLFFGLSPDAKVDNLKSLLGFPLFNPLDVASPSAWSKAFDQRPDVLSSTQQALPFLLESLRLFLKSHQTNNSCAAFLLERSLAEGLELQLENMLSLLDPSVQPRFQLWIDPEDNFSYISGIFLPFVVRKLMDLRSDKNGFIELCLVNPENIVIEDLISQKIQFSQFISMVNLLKTKAWQPIEDTGDQIASFLEVCKGYYRRTERILPKHHDYIRVQETGDYSPEALSVPLPSTIINNFECDIITTSIKAPSTEQTFSPCNWKSLESASKIMSFEISSLSDTEKTHDTIEATKKYFSDSLSGDNEDEIIRSGFLYSYLLDSNPMTKDQAIKVLEIIRNRQEMKADLMQCTDWLSDNGPEILRPAGQNYKAILLSAHSPVTVLDFDERVIRSGLPLKKPIFISFQNFHVDIELAESHITLFDDKDLPK